MTSPMDWLREAFMVDGPVDSYVKDAAMNLASVVGPNVVPEVFTPRRTSGGGQGGPGLPPMESSSPNFVSSASGIMEQRAADYSRAREAQAIQAEPEFDPSDLDFEQAAIGKKLDLSLSNQLSQANKVYDDMLAVHGSDPSLQAEIEESRQNTLGLIQHHFTTAQAQLGSNFANLRRVAREEHNQSLIARQQSDVQIESARLDNELKRLQMEQLGQEDDGAFFPMPQRDDIVAGYNLLTRDSDPTHNINDDEAGVIDAIEAMVRDLQRGVALGIPELLTAAPALAVLQEAGLNADDYSGFLTIINQLEQEALGEASKLR